MTLFKPASLYFLIVFGAGFILGAIRMFLIVPRLGIRRAELLEMPFMLAVIYFASGKINKWFPLRPAGRLGYGLLALAFALAAELAVAVFVQGSSIGGALLGRDPVSGLAFLGSLIIFAILPWLRKAS